MFQKFGAWWQKFIVDMNAKGIAVPMVRDPRTGLGSVSLTLLILAALTVLVGLIGKWSGWLGGIDISSALQFFYACGGLYFGRKWTGKDQSNLGENIEK